MFQTLLTFFDFENIQANRRNKLTEEIRKSIKNELLKLFLHIFFINVDETKPFSRLI